MIGPKRTDEQKKAIETFEAAHKEEHDYLIAERQSALLSKDDNRIAAFNERAIIYKNSALESGVPSGATVAQITNKNTVFGF